LQLIEDFKQFYQMMIIWFNKYLLNKFDKFNKFIKFKFNKSLRNITMRNFNAKIEIF